MVLQLYSDFLVGSCAKLFGSGLVHVAKLGDFRPITWGGVEPP